MKDSDGENLELFSHECSRIDSRIGDNKKSESDPLKEAENPYHTIFDLINDAVFIHDLETGVIVDANQRMCEMYGVTREEALQLRAQDLCSGEPPYTEQDALNWLRKASAGQSQTFEQHARHKAGHLFWVEVSVKRATISGKDRLLVTVRDITERRKVDTALEASESRYSTLLEGLRRSQELGALGTLAGGLAHLLNNTLMTTLGYGSLLQMHIKHDPMARYVDQILASSQKAAVVIQSLLAFSGKQPINLKSVTISKIIAEAELRALLTEDIEFNVTPADPDITIEVDMRQIVQVLMNLATNARDAMPRGGRLAIEAKLVCLSIDSLHRQELGKSREYALISMTDTGLGMDQETERKIFDPFFTTKEVNQGTGLGLSVVYGIIKQHNGYVAVSSEPHKGTRFDIYLPVAQTRRTW